MVYKRLRGIAGYGPQGGASPYNPPPEITRWVIRHLLRRKIDEFLHFLDNIWCTSDGVQGEHGIQTVECISQKIVVEIGAAAGVTI